MPTSVCIDKLELAKLEKAYRKLRALEIGGVDSWEFYDEALKEYRKEEAVEEFIDDFIEDLDEILIDADIDYPAGREAGHSIIVDSCRVSDAVRKLLLKIKENK